MQNGEVSTPLKDCGGRRVPRGEKRREEIAAVAERVFLARGFAETTMQMIAAEACASKETLYRHFGSKEGLISEIMRCRSAQIIGGDDELPDDGPPDETLRAIGRNLLRVVLKLDSLALLRGVIAEAPRAPELARIFYEQGPARTLGKLARYLGAATRRGELCCADPELAAKLFLGAVVGNRQLRELVTPGSDVFGEEEIRTHVEEAVSLFLARYGRDFAAKA